MQKKGLTNLAFHKFKRSFWGVISFCFISFVGFISLFAYVIAPDSSQYSNQMHLSIHSKAPGFTVKMLVIPNSLDNNQNLMDRLFFGNLNPPKEIPISSFFFFSILFFLKISSAFFKLVPSGAVMRFSFVITDNHKIHVDFFIRNSDTNGAEDGQKVLIEFKEWKQGDQNPTAKVIEIFGFPGLHKTEMNAIMAEYGLPEHFPDHVEIEAKKISNWGSKLPEGHGLGVAIHYSFYSYVATVVEVSVKSEKVKVENIYSVLDCGMYVNRDAVINQMEGAAIFGMSIAMFGKISTKGGVVEQSNFHDYQMTRMIDAPNIHVHLVDNEEDPTGVGEPGVPPVSAAITNAIFNASGKRVRSLPLSDQGMV